MDLSPSLMNKLVCPLDGHDLEQVKTPEAGVRCSERHFYPVVDGIPVMLPEDVAPTLTPLLRGRAPNSWDAPLYLDTVLLSEDEKKGIRVLAEKGGAIDPVAAYLVGATNGIAYKHLIGTLADYPIPQIRLPKGHGKSLLDIGCSWGRWTVAASRQGYRPTGLDPSLGAVMAARRVARSLGIEADFVVGDGRYLPFRSGAFDCAYSYSVIQHFSFEDAAQAVGEIGRVICEHGKSVVQMPTRYGVRCLYNQMRRGFREAQGFEVRYWSIGQLKTLFERKIGRSELSVDCFLGIGWQTTDAHLMPIRLKTILRVSQFLTRLAYFFPAVQRIADSVYVTSEKSV